MSMARRVAKIAAAMEGRACPACRDRPAHIGFIGFDTEEQANDPAEWAKRGHPLTCPACGRRIVLGAKVYIGMDLDAV
jgi:hypothetical protein